MSIINNTIQIDTKLLSTLDINNINNNDIKNYIGIMINNMYKKPLSDDIYVIYKYFIDITFFKNKKLNNFKINNIQQYNIDNINNSNYKINLEEIYIYNDKIINKEECIQNIRRIHKTNINYDDDKIIETLIFILLQLNKIHMFLYNKLNNKQKEEYIPGVKDNEIKYDVKLFDNIDNDYKEEENISTYNIFSSNPLSLTSSQRLQSQNSSLSLLGSIS